MGFDEVVLCCDHDGVAFVVGGKSRVNAGKVLADLDGSVERMVSVEWTIGCKDEEEVSIVASEMFVAEIVGEVVAEVGPHGHVHILPEGEEEVVEQFGLALPDAHLQVLIGVVVLNGDVREGEAGGRLSGVVEVEEDVVHLQHHQELLAHRRHQLLYIHPQKLKLHRILGKVRKHSSQLASCCKAVLDILAEKQNAMFSTNLGRRKCLQIIGFNMLSIMLFSVFVVRMMGQVLLVLVHEIIVSSHLVQLLQDQLWPAAQKSPKKPLESCIKLLRVYQDYYSKLMSKYSPPELCFCKDGLCKIWDPRAFKCQEFSFS